MEKYIYLLILYLSIISIAHPMNRENINRMEAIRHPILAGSSFGSTALSKYLEQHMEDHEKLVGSFVKECKDFFEKIKSILDIEIEYRLAAENAPFSYMEARYDISSDSFRSDALDEAEKDMMTIAHFDRFDNIQNANIKDGFSSEQLQKADHAWQRAKQFILLNQTRGNDTEENKQRYRIAKEKRKNIFKAFKNLMREFKFDDIDERICRHTIECKLIRQISSNIPKSSGYNKDTLIYSLTKYCYRKFYEMKLYNEDFREYFLLKDKLEQAITFINDITENKPLKDLQIDSSVFIEIINNHCRRIHVFLDDLCGNCIEHYRVLSCSEVPVLQKIQAIQKMENFDDIGDALNEAKEELASFKEDIEINNIRIHPELDSKKLLSRSEDELSQAIVFYSIICEKYGKKLRIPDINRSSSSPSSTVIL